MINRTRTRFPRNLGLFWRDTRASVAVIFILSATALIAFLGAGLDMSRAYVARQELSNVATMTCQYSTRPSVYQVAYSNNNGVATYASQVNSFATQSLANQKFQVTQTNATPFTYSGLGGNGQVSLAASVPTLFLPIVSINSLPVSVTITCAQAQTTTPNSGNSNAGTVVLSESFENSACSGTCYSTFQPNGAQNDPSPTTYSTFSNTVGYVGTTGAEWSIMGYCLEVDTVGEIKNSVPNGTHSAELDCDNATHSAGNSSISNKTYYTAGTYEIRYSYTARIDYPDYDPTYICASTAADLAWANDSNETGLPYGPSVARSNQLNVYFDADQNGLAPTHTTLDGTQTLAGSNMIDQCVYATSWVQRSITINVTTAGYYWLSFAADGANDSYGAQLDAISVCHVSCSGSITDPFPSDWTSSPLLFEDSFESPSSSGTINTSKVLDADYGASNNGWPNQTASGWATGPYDQVALLRGSSLVDDGSQSLELDSAKSGSQTSSRRSVSRSFYLDPGYYAISYDYISGVKFNGVNATNCTYAPSSSSALTAYSSTTSTAGKSLITNASGYWPADTNAVAVFMSNSLQASYPVGNGGLNSTTYYTNPGSSTTTSTPTVAPDAVSTSSYNTAQMNPVLDYCNYASAWTARTTYVRITKPGSYWLTIGAVGAASSQDLTGGIIDDVKVTAYGSLYGSGPSFYATVPTPGPANGSTVTYTGFTLVADPLAPT
jgi:hypothetical protein